MSVRLRLRTTVAGLALLTLLAPFLVAVSSVDAADRAFPAECEVTLCAGAGRGDVTPPVTSPLWGYADRAGYARPEAYLSQRLGSIDTDLYTKGIFLRSEGYHTRLHARSIVLRAPDGELLALVQTDLGHIPGEVFRAAAADLARLGISRESLLVSATHTHGGPGAFHQQGLSAALVGDNYDPRLVGRVVDGIVASVSRALEDLAPARAALGQTTVVGVQGNRSFEAHLENPCPDPAALDDGLDCAAGGGPQAPQHIDPLGTMVRVDRADGAPVGVWTSLAVHGTVFGPELLVTADNQGVAARLIEEGIRDRAGARADGRDIVAAYANGAQGDINPFCPGVAGFASGYEAFSCSEDLGRIQAERFLSLYDDLAEELTNDLVLDARIDSMLMDGEGGTSPLAVLGGGPSCASAGLVPGQGGKCPLAVVSGTGPQWFWIQTMRIGDTVLANVPGEMTVQMARRVRAQLLRSEANVDADGGPVLTRALVVGLANDYMGYLTTPEEYEAQAYEGTFTFFGTQQGPYVADRLQVLSDAMVTGEEVALSFNPPDTSATRTANVSPATQALSTVTDGGTPAGTALVQPASVVARGDLATFRWAGGQPSAEVQPDLPFVTVERLTDGAWTVVEVDGDLGMVIRHQRMGLDDAWSADWEAPFTALPGRYRLRVTGFSYDGGQLRSYELTSDELTVVASSALVVTSAEATDGLVMVTAGYPEPDLQRTIRRRPPAVVDGSVTVVVQHGDGSMSTGTGAYDAAASAFLVAVPAARLGDVVEVAPGALTDGAGNRSG